MELDHLDTALCLFNPPNTEPPSNEFEVPVLFTLLFSACIWPSCSDDALSLGLVDSFCFFKWNDNDEIDLDIFLRVFSFG